MRCTVVKSVEGIYKDGKVELLEPPPPVSDVRVIVTFLSAGTGVDLTARGILPEQAAELRQRLKAFAPDWERPEMDVYDAL
jgi:hypothetical protein